MKKNYYEQR